MNDFDPNGDDGHETCGKKLMPALFAWFLLITTSSAYFIIVFPLFIDLIGDDRRYFYAVYAAHVVLFVFTVFNFLISTFMDPGRFPKVDVSEALEDTKQPSNYKNVLINEVNVRMKWCTTCQFYRPPRSSHCGVCNACIDTMDHHCPWICNCIAKRNYKYFLQFLITLTIHMLVILGFSITIVILNKDNLTQMPIIVATFLIVIVGILIIPIGGLTGFHIVLVSRGRTTNEQVTGKFRTGVNPFDRGFCINWNRVMCVSRPPSYISFVNKQRKQREYYETMILLGKSKSMASTAKIKNCVVSPPISKIREKQQPTPAIQAAQSVYKVANPPPANKHKLVNGSASNNNKNYIHQQQQRSQIDMNAFFAASDTGDENNRLLSSSSSTQMSVDNNRPLSAKSASAKKSKKKMNYDAVPVIDEDYEHTNADYNANVDAERVWINRENKTAKSKRSSSTQRQPQQQQQQQQNNIETTKPVILNGAGKKLHLLNGGRSNSSTSSNLSSTNTNSNMSNNNNRDKQLTSKLAKASAISGLGDNQFARNNSYAKANYAANAQLDTFEMISNGVKRLHQYEMNETNRKLKGGLRGGKNYEYTDDDMNGNDGELNGYHHEANDSNDDENVPNESNRNKRRNRKQASNSRLPSSNNGNGKKENSRRAHSRQRKVEQEQEQQQAALYQYELDEHAMNPDYASYEITV